MCCPPVWPELRVFGTLPSCTLPPGPDLCKGLRDFLAVLFTGTDTYVRSVINGDFNSCMPPDDAPCILGGGVLTLNLSHALDPPLLQRQA